MSVSQFASESYLEDDRRPAWQDMLRGLGLTSTAPAVSHGFHATAAFRYAPGGVALGRWSAGPQILTSTRSRADLPLVLLPLDDGAALHVQGVRRPLTVRTLVVLPRSEPWQIVFEGDVRTIALSVTAELFRGRKIGPLEFGRARALDRHGLAAVLAGTLEATTDGLEQLADADWRAIDLSLAEMLLTVLRQSQTRGRETAGTATQASLLHRICRTIERRLDEHDLSPGRVAQAEGISERYLQRLFEVGNDNFSHYLRERRLQKARDDLGNPAESHRSVSEIAYRCGFNDAANFSRAFRQRYGLSPRAFRQKEAERTAEVTSPREQRGWPQDALAQIRAHLTAHGGKRAKADEGATGQPKLEPGPRAHHLPVDVANVHWGFFSRSLKPVIEIESGDTIEIETLSQHASDDVERMISGDRAAERVFRWTAESKAVDRRGAGPMDASIFGRGAGEGFGVHICTGPIAVRGAEPGDVLEVRILDMVPRPSCNPKFAGRVFGSSAAAWWGYHYAELLTDPKPREVVTIYEILPSAPQPFARAVYSYRWDTQIDPFGIAHKTYDYPGIPIAQDAVVPRRPVLDGIAIPLRLHFGVIGVAPKELDLVDSIPPAYFGGNLDNWRLGKGAAVYLPVSVPGALLSIGDPHAAQGDGELAGTAIECSMTGTVAVVLHKKADLHGQPFADVTYPLIETETEWVLTGFSHPNYLAEFGAKGQSEVYATSSLDLAMKDAFRKVRRFLMTAKGLSEDEAIALMSAAVDFGVTQVVDGNWGVHAILSKTLFADPARH